ncbi:MAG: hypothetical protein ACHREM_14490 [Polyangiales bacterium]
MSLSVGHSEIYTEAIYFNPKFGCPLKRPWSRRSRDMANPTTPSAKSTSTPNPKSITDPAKPQDDTALADQPKAETTSAPVASASPSGEKSVDPSKTLLSVSLPEKLGRQLRLLGRLEGKTLSAIVQAALEAEVPKRLKAALATITDD